MSLESAITFFIAMFVFGITPGPGVFAILARAMVQGWRKCVTLSLGMICSDLIYLALACFGLATIAENWSIAFEVIRYVGAAYLIYLGYKMFKSLPEVQGSAELAAKQSQKSELASFAQGFLISASNPKVILFYISFLPTFIDLTVLRSQDIVLVSALASVALMSGLMLIAVGAGRMAGLLKTPRAHKRLNQSAGGIMIAAGSYLAINR
ncbi:LysE family translocator [Vibrio sp. 10N.222.54.A1]|jgi:threonine/homoserine/homoserine lactone efflux protein|uniref:LysE family translocator n=1 Tax=Vibrio TaxID=662 RepID=UPI00031B499D|nr:MULTISPECIES: LysE family translocator [Vibrio]MCK8072378.1 LysE family translocator [Vibrio sp. 1CM23M]NOH92501.1 LysE family translocator [Vibrio sp. AIC-3]OED86951.1 threonine transporter [Vibrio crassostreae ZF-91]OEF06675.1 threonine transporter [Vibrio crassostreae 9ZC77]PMK84811.1 threonine transporter [Vibrio sp. 10N.261.52.E5]